MALGLWHYRLIFGITKTRKDSLGNLWGFRNALILEVFYNVSFPMALSIWFNLCVAHTSDFCWFLVPILACLNDSNSCFYDCYYKSMKLVWVSLIGKAMIAILFTQAGQPFSMTVMYVLWEERYPETSSQYCHLLLICLNVNMFPANIT